MAAFPDRPRRCRSMADSAFIVHVPDAEPRVGSLRERFDATVKLGVPAHITVLTPFMPPGRITAAVLEQAGRALGQVAAFPFTLRKVRRFPAVAYLAPEPAAPFVALTQNLVRSFPDYPPFRGEFESIIPHLTVAHGTAPDVEAAATELEGVMQKHGPVESTCSAVTLIANSSGRWKTMHVFDLPGRTA